MRTTCATIALVIASCVHAQQIIEVPPLAGDDSMSIGDMADGGEVVVGESWSGFPLDRFTPVVWRHGLGTQALPLVFGTLAQRVSGISADGRFVAGATVDPSTGLGVGVRWDLEGGVETIAPPPGFSRLFPLGMSDDGQAIVGLLDSDDGLEPAFVWDSTSGVRLLPPPDGFSKAVAQAVNSDGRVVAGFASSPGRALVPCIWEDGQPVRVLPLPADAEGGYLVDISGDGSRVTGSYTDPVATYFAYVWDRDEGLLDLGLHGDTSGAGSMSRDGRIVAWSWPGGTRVYDNELGLIEVRRYLEARRLSWELPDRFSPTALSPDGSSLAIAYVVGPERDYRVAIITGFTLPTDCPPDIDLNETLDTFDFLAFVNRFNAGDLRADLDGDGELTITDFIAFQAAFAAGC